MEPKPDMMRLELIESWFKFWKLTPGGSFTTTISGGVAVPEGVVALTRILSISKVNAAAEPDPSITDPEHKIETLLLPSVPLIAMGITPRMLLLFAVPVTATKLCMVIDCDTVPEFASHHMPVVVVPLMV